MRFDRHNSAGSLFQGRKDSQPEVEGNLRRSGTDSAEAVNRVDLSLSSANEGFRVVNSNIIKEIFEALSNHAFISGQSESSHTLSAGVLIRAVLAVRQLATFAASRGSIGVRTMKAFRSLNTVSIVLEESVGAFDTVFRGSFDALLAGRVAFGALSSITISVVSLGAGRLALVLSFDEVVSN
jgi:hypothetical protein